jgi:hypothetical protein
VLLFERADIETAMERGDLMAVVRLKWREAVKVGVFSTLKSAAIR